MKKVTRLLRPKSKKGKDAQYNALSGGNGSGRGSVSTTASAAEPIPAVHNYGQNKTKVKVKSTTTQPTKGKLHGVRKKIRWASSKEAPVFNVTASTDRASESSIADNNNFNYSSLNRKRSSYSNSSCGSIATRDVVASATGRCLALNISVNLSITLSVGSLTFVEIGYISRGKLRKK